MAELVDERTDLLVRVPCPTKTPSVTTKLSFGIANAFPLLVRRHSREPRSCSRRSSPVRGLKFGALMALNSVRTGLRSASCGTRLPPPRLYVVPLAAPASRCRRSRSVRSGCSHRGGGEHRHDPAQIGRQRQVARAGRLGAHVVHLDVEILADDAGARSRQVHVDDAVAIRVVAVGLPTVEQLVPVGVGARRSRRSRAPGRPTRCSRARR